MKVINSKLENDILNVYERIAKFAHIDGMSSNTKMDQKRM